MVGRKLQINKLFFFVYVLFFFLPISNVYAGYFVVENTGEDVIVVNNGYSQYIVEYNYECYSSDFFEGDTIYIDSSYTPMYGDTIVTSGYSKKTCEVTDAEDVNLKKYFVEEVLDNDDKIIVADKLGDSYLVEYGLGCGLSFWRYEGKTIDIDIGGAFLDGIGDQIYLLDDGDDCKVWDAEELSGSYSGGSTSSYSGTYTPPPPTTQTCPANSYLATNGQCSCNAGYIVNPAKTACVPAPTCPEGSFLDSNNLCTTYTQSCKAVNNNDPLIIGSKGEGTKINCACVNGYSWNGSQCVLNTPTTQKTNSNTGIFNNIQTSKSVETKKEIVKIDDSKIELLSTEIPTTLKTAGNLRECPSTTCPTMRYYAETANVMVIGSYNDGEWFKVKGKNDSGNSIEGWMHNSVLEKITVPVKDNPPSFEDFASKDKSTTSSTNTTDSSNRESWIKRLWHFFFKK